MKTDEDVIDEEIPTTEELSKEIKNLKYQMGSAFNKLDRFMTKMEKSILEMQKNLKSHEHELKRITEVNENVETILGNVLLAIRQNEYLQAYYPPQNGHPEMKVIGKHPSQSE